MEIPKLGCYNLDKNHWSFVMPSICAPVEFFAQWQNSGSWIGWCVAIGSRQQYIFLDTCQDPSQARIFCANYLVELVEIVATLGEGYLVGSGWWFGTFFIFAYN